MNLSIECIINDTLIIINIYMKMSVQVQYMVINLNQNKFNGITSVSTSVDVFSMHAVRSSVDNYLQ